MATMGHPFFVIDPQTHKEVNAVAISETEPWAKDLTCNIDGFALTEDGYLVLFDNCGHLAYVPDGRFNVRQVLVPDPGTVGFCPFCGGRGVVGCTLRDGYQNFRDDPDAFAYWVECVSCACHGPWEKSVSAALRRWRTRTIVTQSAPLLG